jgi:hypothetical protein
LHIERTLVRKDFPSCQLEAFPIDEQFDREPIGSIGQLLFPDGNIIEDTLEQRGSTGAEVALFEGAARGEIAIANGVDAFLCMHLFGVKTLFGDLPEIHTCFSPHLSQVVRLHRKESRLISSQRHHTEEHSSRKWVTV